MIIEELESIVEPGTSTYFVAGFATAVVAYGGYVLIAALLTS